jgi:hypothetical protein
VDQKGPDCQMGFLRESVNKGSRSFLKKRTKKLLIPAGLATVSARCFHKQTFFASFFQKRSACFTSNPQ